jgi:hypothetical protein
MKLSLIYQDNMKATILRLERTRLACQRAKAR